MRVLLTALFQVLLFHSESYSQRNKCQEILQSIQKSVADNFHLTLHGNNLGIHVTNAQGNIIREDYVPLFYLDTISYFENETHLFCVPCLDSQPGCVTRSMKIERIKKQFNRISILLKNDEDAGQVKIAFKELNLIITQPGYKNEIKTD